MFPLIKIRRCQLAQCVSKTNKLINYHLFISIEHRQKVVTSSTQNLLFNYHSLFHIDSQLGKINLLSRFFSFLIFNNTTFATGRVFVCRRQYQLCIQSIQCLRMNDRILLHSSTHFYISFNNVISCVSELNVDWPATMRTSITIRSSDVSYTGADRFSFTVQIANTFIETKRKIQKTNPC